MKPSEMLSGSFWCGFVTHLSFNCMYQDFIGKDAFLAKVEADWMNTSPYMWMIFIAMALFAHFWNKSKVE